MSEIVAGGGRRRRRRADADRSAATVLEAAVDVLGRHPDARVERVAAAAGVARQTVYAHYPSRRRLVAAVIDRITAEAVAAFDAAAADTGSATDALLRWLEATWRMFDRYPLLLHPSAAATDQAESDRQHAPVAERLQQLIARGRDSGEFDRTLDPGWLISATIALGHAAAAEIAAGRMTPTQAADALRHSVLRLYGVPQS